MNKCLRNAFALVLMAVAMVFASCSKDKNDAVGPTQQEIEKMIVGKWKTVTSNGANVPTNYRTVHTYYANRTQICSTSRFFEETGLYAWENQTPYTWSAEGNVLCSKPAGDVGVIQYNQVITIDNHQCVFKTNKIIDQQGVEYTYNWKSVAQKVTADYSKDIIGMWEGISMTGYETYGDYHHRIEYRADGTYTYYSWDEITQTWQPLEDVFDEWNVDGDWLATRWQNNGSDVMNYEWWDIDYIKQEGSDTIMKWSALREKEGGERFTTTFTWKKVK